MTQCVVVLGLFCVEMCLVQSWFGLCSFFFSCTSVLLLFVELVCLSVDFKLLCFGDCLFFFLDIPFFCNIKFWHTSPHSHLLALRFSLALTHTPAHTTTPFNFTPRPVNPSLCCVVCVSLVADCGSCFLAVAESQ